MNQPFGPPQILDAVRRIHARLRARVIAACESQSVDQLSGGADAGAGDFIYEIDRVSEEELVELVDREIAAHVPIVLVAEGVGDGKVVLPHSAKEADALWRIIVDPIDGTRGLMYQKRPAWILTGVAPNHGPETSLADIQIAVQTELPLVKQHLCDEAWAVVGEGVHVRRWNRLTEEYAVVTPRPSTAADLSHGFGTICRFFPGARDVLARLDDELCTRLMGPRKVGEALVFEDQYASTGGQIYGLLAGQDRFVADLRPLMAGVLAERGQPLGHCCHPYDLCTKLIAEEAGVAITGPDGKPVQAPLDVHANVAWVGYANATLRRLIEPVLQELLAFLD